MKICILGFCNLTIMQYLYKYTTILDEKGIEYDVVYWNRLGIHEDASFKGQAISFNSTINTYQPFRKKIIQFIQYAQFMRDKIKKGKYSKLIVLTTQTAIPLFDILCTKYKGKYIYDFRDITKEKFSIYRKAVIELINNSFITMVSSAGFIREIGIKNTRKIQIAHNTQSIGFKRVKPNYNANNNPIRIVYWGIIRQLEHNKRVCDCFGKDDRFQVVFHGTGLNDELQAYCQKKKYSNISFTGLYKQSNITIFAEEADILHCIYENDAEQKPAMPVKAYDAIRYQLPVLVNSNCQVADFFQGIPGALSVELSKDNINNTVYEWYKSLSNEQIEEGYKLLQEKILSDDIKFKNVLLHFCDLQNE